MKRLERKIGFLAMELQDIKNNKGTLTLQVKSVEHLQTWLKKSDHLKQSELLIQHVDLSFGVLKDSLGLADLTKTWWLASSKEDEEQSLPLQVKTADEFKRSKTQSEILSVAKQQHMNTDIKKAVFQAIVGSEDYIQAFESVTRLGLKKQQEREIIKVLVQCCINEKKVFNKFYGLLAQRLCRYEPQSFRYSLKYTLWDYLKALDSYDVRQTANLARLYAMLIAKNDVPLHFLKVLDFGELSKPQQLFLFVLFDSIVDESSKEELKVVFRKGLKAGQAKANAQDSDAEPEDDKLGDFRRGLSEYLLTRFYLKKKRDGEMS